MNGTSCDIRKDRRVEKKPHLTDYHCRLLFETMLQGVVYFDTEGKIFSANPAAEQILGKTSAELHGKTPMDLEQDTIREDGSLFPGTEHPAMMALRTGQEQPVTVMGVYNPRDQLYRWVNIRAVPLFQPGEEKPDQVYTLCDDITERKELEEEVHENHQMIRSMAMKLAIAEEQERCRIAGELHDKVAQGLILSKIKLGSLKTLLSSETYEGPIEAIENLITQSIQDIRSLTFQLRPPILANAGLIAALKWLAEEIRKDVGLLVEIRNRTELSALKYEIRSVIFQAVRELLLNVSKHAGSTKARISIEQEAKNIIVTVEDDGIGFAPALTGLIRPRNGGFGLFNAQQRIEHLGGRLVIKSLPGSGSRISIIVPADMA